MCAHLIRDVRLDVQVGEGFRFAKQNESRFPVLGEITLSAARIEITGSRQFSSAS